MIALYSLIFSVYVYSVYDAFYVRKHFEQTFYLVLSVVTSVLLPTLYYGPILFFPLYGLAYGIFIHNTPIGTFIIDKNKNSAKWSSDEKWLLHGIISFVKYCVIGYGLNMVLCNNHMENYEQKFIDTISNSF